jgi:WD40 repeat protein
MPADPNRVRDVFLSAAAVPDAERAAYLDRACDPDLELRAEVERLLAAHDAPASVLEPPVPALPPTDFHTPQPDAGTVLAGRYKLLEEIGEGGMGTVWVAQQTQPIKRTVAVKLIKPGMDSRTVLVRFEAERQALALMDHPNIARVLDAGATTDGRPFFVMELVRGVPITRFCDERRLTPRQRLELFVPVCQAIQHAHQKGVIHRDLKPSNVLVAMYDDRPVPKVIDFGVAKAIGQPLTEHTLHTGFGTVIGTPQYMSPEQATFNNLDVDTRSDVYSLGVLLYELLVGSPPFAKGDLERAGVMEMLRVVREVEPPRPSTKLSTADALPTLAANRSTEPKALTGMLRSELDWVVMKALEKDRTRRYETANGFAADLLRYLGGEPVQAVPPSMSYRLRKFVRKHKGRVVIAAVLGLALLGAAGGTGYGVLEAGHQRVANSLREQAEDARDAAERARRQAETARDGEARERQAAVVARDGEKTARTSAETARDLLALEREKLAHYEYGRTIQVAYQEWKNGNIAIALALLGGTRGDLRGWEYDYVYRLCHGQYLTIGDFANQPSTLQTLSSFMTVAAFSPDGTRVVTAARDKTAQLWDARTGAKRAVLTGHTDNVTSAAFSPDSRWVVTTSADNTVRVWDAVTGAERTIFKGHAQRVTSAQFSPGSRWVVTASVDRTARVWDAETGAELVALTGARTAVRSAAFSPDGLLVVTIPFDGTARVWDVATGVELATLRGHRGLVISAAFSPDGQRLVTVSSDLTVRVWDAVTGAQRAVLTGHSKPVSSAVFSPNGRHVVTASWDRTARLWDAETGAELAVLTGHTAEVLSAAFSPDGQRVVTASVDKTARLWEAAPGRAWDPTTGGELAVFKGHTQRVTSAAFSPDGRRVFTAAWDNSVRVWDATGEVESVAVALKGHTGDTLCAAFSPDARRVLVASADKTARVWEVPSARRFPPQDGRGSEGYAVTGTELASLKGFKNAVRAAAFSPDGQLLVTVAISDETVRVWDAATGAERAAFKGHGDEILSAAFSPDGKRVVTSSWDKTARVWDAATGAELAVFKGHTNRVIAAAFSPDGTRVVTGSWDKTARVWDAATGTELLTLQGHTGTVMGAAFSPDGTRVVTAGGDKTARVWNAATGTEIAVLKGHTSPLKAAVFGPDTRRVVSVSTDRTVRVWDAATGAELATLKGYTNEPRGVVFAPDGRQILTVSGNTIRVWDATPVERRMK